MQRSKTVAIVTTFLVLLPLTGNVAQAEEPDLRVRRSVTSLNAQQRADLVAALLKLKETPSPFDARCPGEGCLSYYDQFVQWHVELIMCEATDPVDLNKRMRGHLGPIFLPWHRKMLLLLEEALRSVSGEDITIPYWDWTDPASVDSIFATDFMGGDGDPAEGYAVTSGPFRRETWPFAITGGGTLGAIESTPYLSRHLGAMTDLPTRADVTAALGIGTYDVAPFTEDSDPNRSFRNRLEGIGEAKPIETPGLCAPDGTGGVLPWPIAPTGMHNLVHFWTGGSVGPSLDTPYAVGTMSAVPVSPNDPVFFLHHANVDRIWAQWQGIHGIDTFEPDSGNPNNDESTVMAPFDVTPRDVLDTTALGYRYADSGPPAAVRPSLRAFSEMSDRLGAWACNVG